MINSRLGSMDSDSLFKKNIENLKEIFSRCTTPEKRYEKIIECASFLPPFNEAEKTEKNLVPGCQSILYVSVHLKENRVFFTAFSEALISKGLAALLFYVYNGVSPEIILKNPPVFLKDLGILSSLSPSRSNGVLSLFKKIQTSVILLLSHQKSDSSII